jgi:hypothetical protein
VRARERLRHAAALLRAHAVVIDDSAGFHAGVLSALNSLPADDRERLRSQVDWVEEYSAAEVCFFGALAHAGQLPATPGRAARRASR